jgi:hypothetical protein
MGSVTIYVVGPRPSFAVQVGRASRVVLFENIDLALDHIRAVMLDYDGRENPQKWDDSNVNYRGAGNERNI